MSVGKFAEFEGAEKRVTGGENRSAQEIVQDAVSCGDTCGLGMMKLFIDRNVFVAFKKATLFQVVTTALKLQSVLVLKQWIISHKNLISREPAFFQVLFKMRLHKVSSAP